MPALSRVPTVQLWHSEVPTLAKVILPDAVRRMDHGQPGSYQLAGRVSTDKALVLRDLANFRVVGKPEIIGPHCQAQVGRIIGN